MKNRKAGYAAVSVGVTGTIVDSSDDEPNDDLKNEGTQIALMKKHDLTVADEEIDSDGGSSLEDDERLNSQLELEIAEITKLNAVLNDERNQSSYCLFRCFCGTKNSRIISVWFFTFLIFGVIEIVGSLKANSLSMMGDAVLMILDAVTYGANIYADYECSKPSRQNDKLFKDRTHFAASLFSLVVISVVEVYVITDAILRILAPVEDEEPVDASIMFILTGINAVLDVIGAVMLCWEHKCCCSWRRLRTDVNMFSAALHLVSDCFRTLAVIIAACLIQFDSVNIDGDIADAGTSLAVSILISFGALLLCKEVYTLAMKLWGPQSPEVTAGGA